MKRRKKVMATLELLMDYLSDAESEWEATAYQEIGKLVFLLNQKKEGETP